METAASFEARYAPSSHPTPYIMMIIGIYATLGVFLLLASRDPLAKA